MAKKKVKAKKVTVTKEQNNNAAMTDINELHACINKDNDQLKKLYSKAIASADKNVLTVKKALSKAKKKVMKTKRVKAKTPGVYQTALSEMQSLQKQLKGMKEEQACIEAGHTQFNAQQKALVKFEKRWTKKASGTKKKANKQLGKLAKQRRIAAENVTSHVSQLV